VESPLKIEEVITMAMGTPQAPNFSGGLLGILSGLLPGYQGEKQQLEQQKETKAEDIQKQQLFNQQSQLNTQTMASNALTIQQTTDQIGSSKKAAAAADLRGITQQMITDPSRAKDPAFMAKYKALSEASGQLPELTKDGKSVDIDRLKTPFDTLAGDPKKMTELAQLPAPARKAILDQFSGVPKSLYSAKPFVDAKDQASLDRVAALNSHYIHQDTVSARMADVKSMYYDAVTGELIPAHAAQYYAASGLDAARGSAVVTTAGAAATRAAAYTQSVNNVQQRFQSSPNGSMGAVRSLLTTSTTQLRGLQTSVDDAEKSLASAYANVTDPDQLAAAADEVTKAKAELKTATEADRTLRESVRNNPQVSSFLGAASGKPADNVGGGSNNKTLYSTSGGKPIVSKDGGKTWNFS
jgi:hypothetical protein